MIMREMVERVGTLLQNSPRKKRKSDMMNGSKASTEGVAAAEEEGRIRKSPTIVRNRHPAAAPPSNGISAGPERPRPVPQILDEAIRLYNLVEPSDSDAAALTLRGELASLAASHFDPVETDRRLRSDLEPLETMPEGPELWRTLRAKAKDLLEHFFDQVDGEISDRLDGDRGPPALLDDLIRVLDLLEPYIAPARDDQLSSARSLLLSARSSAPGSSMREAIRATFEVMLLSNADMAAFRHRLLGGKGAKEDMWTAVKAEAQRRGREAVATVWGKVTQAQISEWLADRTLGGAILDVVFSRFPVSAPPPRSLRTDGAPTSGNQLPPFLCIQTIRLFKLQNDLQLVVTLAALSVVLGPAPPSSSAPPTSVWFPRLAAILESATSPDPSSSDPPTTLQNVFDIIASARPDKHGKELEDSVRRVLRYEDPVWSLLQRRLKDALLTALSAAPIAASAQAPSALRTGRSEASTSADGQTGRGKVVVAKVKGFEGDFLRGKVDAAATEVRRMTDWTEQAWADLL